MIEYQLPHGMMKYIRMHLGNDMIAMFVIMEKKLFPYLIKANENCSVI